MSLQGRSRAPAGWDPRGTLAAPAGRDPHGTLAAPAGGDLHGLALAAPTARRPAAVVATCAYASRVGALCAMAAALSLIAACSGKQPDADPAALAALDKQIVALESSVRAVSDASAILQNEMRYTRGLDRHDAPLARAAYWDDATITYGNVVAVNEIGPWANAGHAKRAAHQHHLTGMSLDVTGNTAHEEGDILFTADILRDTRFDTNGVPSPGRVLKGSKATLGTGRYVNRYERRDGEWKMIVHEYVHDLSVSFQPVDLCATACLGRWDPSDLSYQRPLQALSPTEFQERVQRGGKPTAELAN